MKTLAELFEELEKLPLECEAGPLVNSAVYRMLKAEALAQTQAAALWRGEAHTSLEQLQEDAQWLIDKANQSGMVVRIETRPLLLPLAMGNYEMVAHVQRKAEPR